MGTDGRPEKKWIITRIEDSDVDMNQNLNKHNGQRKKTCYQTLDVAVDLKILRIKVELFLVFWKKRF